MEFFALNKEQEQLLNELQVRINRLQSGGTLDSVANVGGSTAKHIGASFLSLKTLAARYAKDDKIATILWNSGKREQQIVASFLFTEALNTEKIIQLLSKALNNEVVEYFGSQFMAKHPILPQFASECRDSEDSNIQLVLLSGCAKHLQIYKSDSKIDKEFFELLVNKSYKDPYITLVANRYKV
ncbi:MAG: hypothetical protein ACRDDZ_07465 [Marinifilaceae bacterium]